MKNQHLALALVGLLFAVPLSASADEEGGLITVMQNFQYFMHKTALSLDARNQELVDFYAHEIEENIEAVEEIEKFKQHNIEKMIRTTLVPAFERFEKSVKKNDLDKADEQFADMVTACNQCHTQVQRPYLKIERVDTNPYMQSFAK
jgi:hypothetical protein